MTYSLLDSGDQYKLERFGPYVLSRPCAQAVWRPVLPRQTWKGADAHFTRDEGNKWTLKRSLPTSWNTSLHGLLFKVTPTDFGHIGLFPEHASQWIWMDAHIQAAARVLKKDSAGIKFICLYRGRHISSSSCRCCCMPFRRFKSIRGMGT